MPITTEDIARQLGVSSRLVRYALRDHPGVAAETRRRVLETAARMGYDASQNHSAKTLAARRYGRRVRNNTIAVMVPEFSPSPFYTPLLDGIQQQAQGWGMSPEDHIDVCLFAFRRPTYPRLVQQGNFDGIIWLKTLLEMGGDSSIQDIGIPSISLTIPQDGMYNVIPDNRAGMRSLVEHLAGLGHRRIAYLGQPLWVPTARERFEGFTEGLEEHGLTLYPEVVENTMMQISFANDKFELLLERTTDFTALVCYNDLIAMQAVRRLEHRGLRVPCDVSVVGFDDISIPSNYPLPITSVSFDREAMGRRAVQWIYENFATEEGGSRRAVEPASQRFEGLKGCVGTEIYPVRLEVRESTAMVGQRSPLRGSAVDNPNSFQGKRSLL